MSDLTTYPIHQTAHNRRFTYVAFYTLPEGVQSFLDIPEGGEFGIVHTPSPSTTSKDFEKWTYTRWRVTHQRYKRDTEPQRYYYIVADRELTDNEREHFEAIVSNAILWEMGRAISLCNVQYGITPAPLEREEKEVQI